MLYKCIKIKSDCFVNLIYVQIQNNRIRITNYMVKQHLQVFVRVKPNADKQKSQYYINGNTLNLDVQRNRMSNARDRYEFQFNKAFSEQANQGKIFESVAKPVIDNCLDGYNGTIFAYGQTGSGKTYTMSGGDKWAQRGIIPRVLSYVFQQFQRRSKDTEYSLQVSFIEIYNQNAYDLLDQRHSQSNFETWSKIIFMEDQDSTLIMKNAQTHFCSKEEKAIQYLMMGNYLRKINSTNLNQVSSRSHCIFTLNIRGKNRSTLAEVYSKIHLVDLAGSQRVSKSQAQGLILTQAKSINLSLTYLQQVIVALNQKSKSKTKQHIPYRNSLLTTLLKDSLGGNCKTVMIATISMEQTNLQESISTLRFSQRVKQIQNQISKNQKDLYPSELQALSKENFILRKKLQQYERQKQNSYSHLTGKSYISAPLSDQSMKAKVQAFMKDKNQSLQVGSLAQAQHCFHKMRQMYNRKMREYATQLTFISQKLQKYDQILTKKESRKTGYWDGSVQEQALRQRY